MQRVVPPDAGAVGEARGGRGASGRRLEQLRGIGRKCAFYNSFAGSVPTKFERLSSAQRGEMRRVRRCRGRCGRPAADARSGAARWPRRSAPERSSPARSPPSCRAGAISGRAASAASAAGSLPQCAKCPMKKRLEKLEKAFKA